ncbi:serine/threonine-protein kinase [Nocardia sp. NPDC057353]|uniref:serine/threonine-protein kinase n=1 Tax=Nocardia sp. NPDC057353 TaxID=3346104 RepID=UPI00362C9A9B
MRPRSTRCWPTPTRYRGSQPHPYCLHGTARCEPEQEDPDMPISAGTIVGGYRVLRVLGAGGMGTVYLAKHPTLPRTDALKVLSPDLSTDREFRARFEREANLAAGLDHPNIVSVYNRGEEAGQLWIAMQYVDGTDAGAELTRIGRGLDPQRALHILAEVGKGLDYAHRRGLLHRDIKPANFLLATPEDGEERVLLTDFGVAKSTDDANELTQTGSFLATIAYAAPEQLAGMPLNHRADLYSLACSFFKLLTGRNPYPGSQPALVMMGHLHQPPPRATEVNPALPHAIDHVFARAMAKEPAERFPNSREFVEAATAALSGRGFSAPTSGFPAQHQPSYGYPTNPRGEVPTESGIVTVRAGAPPKRKGLVIGAVAAVLVVAAAAGGVWALNRDSTPGGQATASATSSVPVAAAPTSVEQARQENPAFLGEPVVMTLFTGDKDEDLSSGVNVFLSPSPQTDFLTGLGFGYNAGYAKEGDEQSPRRLDWLGEYDLTRNVTQGYLIVARSDAKAGGGGLLGLPTTVSQMKATIIVVDDPELVGAIQNWSSNSEQVLLTKLIPILKSRVK